MASWFLSVNVYLATRALKPYSIQGRIKSSMPSEMNHSRLAGGVRNILGYPAAERNDYPRMKTAIPNSTRLISRSNAQPTSLDGLFLFFLYNETLIRQIYLAAAIIVLEPDGCRSAESLKQHRDISKRLVVFRSANISGI